MRKRCRVLLFVALVAGLAVPVVFALSVDSAPVGMQIVRGSTIIPGSLPFAKPDAAKLVGVGTLLFGLAAAVRKIT